VQEQTICYLRKGSGEPEPLRLVKLSSESERLAHRAEPEVLVSDPKGRVSEKWIRFSASHDAPLKRKHRMDPKVQIHFSRPIL
jgi:hypothetical protein